MAIIGNFYEVGIGKQASLGSAASTFYGLKWTTLSVEPQAPRAFDEGVLGNIYDVNSAKVYRKGYNLTVGGNLDSKTIGILFYALTNSVSTSGTAAPYTHTFTVQVNSATVPLYTFAAKAGNVEDVNILDAGINNFSMSAAVENPATYEASFVANGHVAATHSLTYPADNLYVAYEITVEVDNDSNFTSPVQLKATEASVEINRNLQTVQTLGSDKYNVYSFGNLEVTASAKVVLENTTYRDWLFSDNVKALRLTFTDLSVDLGGGVHPQIQVVIPRVVLNGLGRDISKGEIVYENLEMKALGTDPVTITLVNDWDGTQY